MFRINNTIIANIYKNKKSLGVLRSLLRLKYIVLRHFWLFLRHLNFSPNNDVKMVVYICACWLSFYVVSENITPLYHRE